MSKETKLPILRGRPRDAKDIDVTNWLEDIRAGINARRMSPHEQVDFIMQHLYNAAIQVCDATAVFRRSRHDSTVVRHREESWGPMLRQQV